MRSRLVARDFKPKGERGREDLFAAMPPLEAKKILFQEASGMRRRQTGLTVERWELLFVDVKRRIKIVSSATTNGSMSNCLMRQMLVGRWGG